MTISATGNHLHELGKKDGLPLGLRDGRARQFGKLILRHGKKRFGLPSDGQRDFVHNLSERSGDGELEAIARKFLAVPTWDAWLAGVALPERPVQPSYVTPPDFEVHIETPAIDQWAKVTMVAGMPMTVRMRIQKKYQPDLGRILYEEDREMEKREKTKVMSAVIFAWPGASGPGCDGEYRIPQGGVYRYHTSRIWETDVEQILANPGVVMFAPVAKYETHRFPEVIRRMADVIDAKEAEHQELFWFLAYWAMGLRYSAEEANAALGPILPRILTYEIFRSSLSNAFHAGVSNGLNEGALVACRQWIFELGMHRLGEPSPDLRQVIRSIESLDRLEQLAARVLKDNDWDSVMKPG